MAKNLEYKVVSASSTKELEQLVNQEMVKGWQLVGGALALYGGGMYRIGQTMIREKTTKEVKKK